METQLQPEKVPSDRDEDVVARIRIRAYEIWQGHDGGNGCEVEDWLQAEREILAPSSEQSPSVTSKDCAEARHG